MIGGYKPKLQYTDYDDYYWPIMQFKHNGSITLTNNSYSLCPNVPVQGTLEFYYILSETNGTQKIFGKEQHKVQQNGKLKDVTIPIKEGERLHRIVQTVGKPEEIDIFWNNSQFSIEYDMWNYSYSSKETQQIFNKFTIHPVSDHNLFPQTHYVQFKAGGIFSFSFSRVLLNYTDSDVTFTFYGKLTGDLASTHLQHQTFTVPKHTTSPGWIVTTDTETIPVQKNDKFTYWMTASSDFDGTKASTKIKEDLYKAWNNIKDPYSVLFTTFKLLDTSKLHDV